MVYRELGLKLKISTALGNLGYLAQHRGDTQRACALFTEALELCRELGSQQGIAQCLAELAGVAATDGQPERAARLFGASEALYERIGVPWQSVDKVEYDRYLAIAHAALSKEDRKSTRLNSSHLKLSRMPSSA